MPPTGKPQDAWKNNRPRPAAARGNPRAGGGRRWFGAAVLFAALGGAAVGLLVYLRPDPNPTLLAIPVTRYTHPDWPPNPWAEADARGVRDLFGGDSAQAFQFQEKARILQQLSRVADESRDDRRRPVVVTLSALGAVTPGGGVHLVPGDARPDDPTGWIPLADVLQPLRRTSAPRLLVLDLRPAVGPRAVLPAADVNEALDAELARLDAAGDLPFLVLNANTPADGPNVLRPLRRSVFGLALAQGAGGAADGWNDRRGRDGQVNAFELAAYVREVTYRASAAGGFPSQLPRLHGAGADFKIALVPPSGPTPMPAPAEPQPYPDWLLAGWKERDGWVAAGLHRRAPRVVRHLSTEASRAERRWLAGADPKAVAERFEPIAAELRSAARGVTPLDPPARSVARLRGRDPDGERAAEAALRPFFDKLNDPAAKSEELLAARQAVVAKPITPPTAAAVALWTATVGIPEPTHEQLRQVAAAAEALRLPPVAELLTVQLIAGLNADHARRWPAGAIRRLVLAARAAEEAAAIDGRCLPWVRVGLAEADTARRRSVEILFHPKTPDDEHRTATPLLDEAAAGHAAVRRVADGLAAAWREYEETRAVLTDFATAYPDFLVRDSESADRAWAGLVEDFRALDALLHPDEGKRLPELDRLTQLVGGVRAGRNRLAGMVDLPDDPDVSQLEAALGWPGLSHAERLDRLNRLDRGARVATDRVLAAWPAGPTGQTPPAVERKSPAVAQGSVRAVRRLADLVSLVDGPEASADAKAALTVGLAGDAAALDALAGKVRSGWRTRLPDVYRAADAGRQAQIGWAVDPDDVPAGRTDPAGPPNPEPRDRAAREKRFLRWLADDRLTPDAKAVRALNLKAKEAQTTAAGLETIAGDYLGWTP